MKSKEKKREENKRKRKEKKREELIETYVLGVFTPVFPSFNPLLVPESFKRFPTSAYCNTR